MRYEGRSSDEGEEVPQADPPRAANGGGEECEVGIRFSTLAVSSSFQAE